MENKEDFILQHNYKMNEKQKFSVHYLRQEVFTLPKYSLTVRMRFM